MGILGRIKKRAGATGPKRGGLPSRTPKRGGIGAVVKRAAKGARGKIASKQPRQRIKVGKKPTKAPAIRRKPGRHLR